MELFSNKDIERMSSAQRAEYYENIRKKCELINNNQLKFGQDAIKIIYPLLRNYKLEIQGEENIPKDTNAIFLVNHSNSHDIFTAYEVLSFMQRRGSVMVATDCLNPITTEIFNISNATLLDRRKANEKNDSILRLSKKIMDGNDGVIFGESTWNLHPTLPMHNVRQGVSKISAIAQVPIIPTIFEYIEEEGIIKDEAHLFKKCIVIFEKPVMISYGDGLIPQTNLIKETMSEMRQQIWHEYGIIRDSLSDIDPVEYVNHTYVKKFKAIGFTYDSQKEQEFLLFLNGEAKENEYCLTHEGIFCPGITEKNFELKRVLHR